MVDMVNLGQASRLSRDLMQISQALQNFDNGGVIVSMTISAGDLPVEAMRAMPQVPGVPVSTVGISYPPQMVDAIKTSLHSRQDDIRKQLDELGVSGIDPAEPSPAGATPSAARTDTRSPRQPQPPHSSQRR